MKEEYDESLHVTAGELRSLGVPIPERIPDCAWISRNSIRLTSVNNCSLSKDDPYTVNIGLNYEFLEPFNWIEINYEHIP